MAIQDKTLSGSEHDYFSTRSGLPANAGLIEHKMKVFSDAGCGGVGKPFSQMEREWLQKTATSSKLNEGDLWVEMVAKAGVTPVRSTSQNKFLFYNASSSESALTTYIKSLSSLSAYYPLDEASGIVADDKSVNGLDGNIIGSPTMAQSGQSGNSIAFDGINDEIDLGSNALLNADTSDFTFGGLFFINTSVNMFSLASRSSSSTGGYDILVGDSGIAGKVRVRINDASHQSPIVTVSTGAWHWIIGVINRTSNVLEVYTEAGSGGTVGISDAPTVTNSQNPNIGKRAAVFFTGRAQHVFFRKAITTAGEVSQLTTLAGL